VEEPEKGEIARSAALGEKEGGKLIAGGGEGKNLLVTSSREITHFVQRTTAPLKKEDICFPGRKA